ncbi:hypothetical protein ACHAWF_005061 [Thalassiosira exigua]
MGDVNGITPKYCLEVNENDVLCGRGSGPNDRVGNVEFRNLVLSRKAEYLAAPSRDAKGRIASSIVDTVRARGGRFLKKLAPAQAKEAGFKRGVAVYELADEATVLEKTKQTLRQNRAEFVKEQEAAVAFSPAPSADTASGPIPASMAQQLRAMSQHQQLQLQALSNNHNGSMPSIQGSLNPIVLGEDSLDSMHRPNLSAHTAEQLNRTLFSSSSISGVTNPTVANNVNSSNCTTSNSNVQLGRGNSGNPSVLSIDASELCATLGGAGSMSQNSNISNTSADAFRSLLMEYNSEEEKTLIQQYEQLKSQQQQMLHQQKVLPQSFQPNVQFISEEEQLPYVQQQNNQPTHQNPVPSDVYSSLLRQHAISQDQIMEAQQQQHGQKQFMSTGLGPTDGVQQTLPRQQTHAETAAYNPRNDPNKDIDLSGAMNDVMRLQQLLLRHSNDAANDASAPKTSQPCNGPPGLSGAGVSAGDPRNCLHEFHQQLQEQDNPPSPAIQMQHQPPSDGPSTVSGPKFSSNKDGDNLPGSFVMGLSANDQQQLLSQFLEQQAKQFKPSRRQPGSSYREPKQKENDEVEANINATQQLQTQRFETYLAPVNDEQHGALTKAQLNDDKQSQTSNLSNSDACSGLHSAHKMGCDSQSTLKMGSLTDQLAPLKGFKSQNMGWGSQQAQSMESYSDTVLPLNDLEPSKLQWKESGPQLQDASGQTANSQTVNFQRRRQSRRSKRRSSNTSSLKSADLSLRLSSLEPASTENSLSLSFVTANQLARTLDDMSTTSLSASGMWGGNHLKQSATSKASVKNGLDSSMLSLMSMSLSDIGEIAQPMARENFPKESLTENSLTNRRDNDGNIINPRNPMGRVDGNGSTASRPVEVTVEKRDNGDIEEIRFGESVMSLGASLDEEHWQKSAE